MTTTDGPPEPIPGQLLAFAEGSDPAAVLATRLLRGENPTQEEWDNARGTVLAAMLRAERSAVERVKAAAAAADTASEELDAAVTAARAAGCTWQTIGAAAGMTRQSAWKRWARPDETEAPL